MSSVISCCDRDFQVINSNHTDFGLLNVVSEPYFHIAMEYSMVNTLSKVKSLLCLFFSTLVP
jgi:hypothetical protein